MTYIDPPEYPRTREQVFTPGGVAQSASDWLEAIVRRDVEAAWELTCDRFRSALERSHGDAEDADFAERLAAMFPAGIPEWSVMDYCEAVGLDREAVIFANWDAREETEDGFSFQGFRVLMERAPDGRWLVCGLANPGGTWWTGDEAAA